MSLDVSERRELAKCITQVEAIITELRAQASGISIAMPGAKLGPMPGSRG
jgi:hypothetical protein